MTLDTYRTLGRSGLIVSPLSLGTMTFGMPRWGTDDATARDIFNAYVDAGGNAIDTADVYAGGRSEEMVGRCIADRSLRDSVVLSTKCGFHMSLFDSDGQRSPLSGGNGRKHVQSSLDASLKRLGTDYIDLYWMHAWDIVTPVDEVLQTLSDLVRSGKIRYFGLSDGPAWYAAKMSALASAHRVPGPIALQLEYSLASRDIEREHLSAARDCGMAVMPWSPLAGGFLTGKYSRGAGDTGQGEGRLAGANPFQGQFTKFTERNWKILDVLRIVAAEIGRAPAQVALAWAARQPGVGSVLVGASTPTQLRDNIASLAITFTDAQQRALDETSAIDPGMYALFGAEMNSGAVFGGARVERWTG